MSRRPRMVYRGRTHCELCESLAWLPKPEDLPCCPICGGTWAVDALVGLRYCPTCEATAGKRFEERRAARQRERQAEAAQKALEQSVMHFEEAS